MNNLEASHKSVILIFVRYYLPGYRAGGPVRSIANLVRALGSTYDFRIVCLDRDHGLNHPYPNIAHGQWQKQDDALVRYVAPHELGFSFCKEIISEVKPDMIYLNSLFDRAFSMKPVLALGGGRATPILLTPRGELSPGALGLKAGRKRLFLSVARAAALYSKVHWHACSKPEAERIQKLFSPELRKTFLASNLPEAGQTSIRRHAPKYPGKLRIVLAARISPMKNTLAAIRMACKLAEGVELDLWGPLEDKDYWQTCQREIAQIPPGITVNYRGEVEHEKLHVLLHEYDAMLLPTLGENFGHSIIEALDAGLPVVVSDRTPWRSLALAGVGADLPLDDEAAFVGALAAYQAMDEPDMAAVRAACYRYATEWRVSHTNLDDYKKMFNAVIESRKLPCK
ncbi:MAG: glycosyltransferase family 4 protein [Polaromonas sp.]|nr:glycosyltransferase family 4 protein [Polaromonas sp.]MDP3751410.1 glycosyltransferase family 4 protein [Polaromonas sp.]